MNEHSIANEMADSAVSPTRRPRPNVWVGHAAGKDVAANAMALGFAACVWLLWTNQADISALWIPLGIGKLAAFILGVCWLAAWVRISSRLASSTASRSFESLDFSVSPPGLPGPPPDSSVSSTRLLLQAASAAWSCSSRGALAALNYRASGETTTSSSKRAVTGNPIAPSSEPPHTIPLRLSGSINDIRAHDLSSERRCYLRLENL